MVTFLITLGVLLFVNLLLFTFSVNKPEKKVKNLVIEKNEQIIAHTQQFIPDVETTTAQQQIAVTTKQSDPVLVAE